MSKHYLKISDADIKLLFFLWKWKLASTAAISIKFYPDLKGNSVYNRLYRMEKRGLVTKIYNQGATKFFWALTKSGYYFARLCTEPIKEEGFKTENVNHDYILAAFHLGELLAIEDVDCCNFFSEQELRRVEEDNYPLWVPSSSSHRADGYTRIFNKGDNRETILAIEVELSQKSTEEYCMVYDFYEDLDLVNRVMWLVRSKSMAKRLEHNIHDKGRFKNKKHNFTTLDDFLLKGWSAPVVCGPEKGQSFKTLICNNAEAELQQMCNPCSTFALLDGRKKITNQPLRLDAIF